MTTRAMPVSEFLSTQLVVYTVLLDQTHYERYEFRYIFKYLNTWHDIQTQAKYVLFRNYQTKPHF